MRRFPRRVRDFAASLAGRIALLLMLGIVIASIASLVVADHLRILALQHLQLERVVASTADIADRFVHNPQATQGQLDRRELFGVRNAMPDAVLGDADPRLADMLEQSLGPRSAITVRRITNKCFGDAYVNRNSIAGVKGKLDIVCWQVGFTDARGVRRLVTIDLFALEIPHNGSLDPIYLFLIVLASALVSLWAARLTTVPLRRLTGAAQRFSLSIDPEAIPVTGPGEVRVALETFNLMQQRVRDGFRERTHILAAIAHDLQTPITRLRLRLEHVQDAPLRERLVGDLAAMQALVRDGLDLARSSENREEWSMVDIDSLVTSLVEDHIEMGAPVSLSSQCSVSAWIKPDALTRCLENLISNAIKYGGEARVTCARREGLVEIAVADSGPGIPEERLAEMFEPFVRGETSRSRSTGGTGIGLTIARAQANSFGAVLQLANRPEGGVVARLGFPIHGPDGAA
ncbi:ATP-binding protein [Novosphingobium rosa]|uniref:ATP-binding protein n=1 Tax=Novosphingobium rosa TaxID=76978 RepID=UPI000837662B|nr:ATP-binding protein [Novosphingobium rosa]